MTLTLTEVPGIPLINPGDDISKLIFDNLVKSNIYLLDGDIVVIAQKIISKSENRLVNLVSIHPSEKAFELSKNSGKDPRLIELILRESKEIIRVRQGSIICEHNIGFVCANAGIDHSNVSGPGTNDDDWVLLLPLNPDLSAGKIRTEIEKLSGVNIGVLIIDSHGRAWRLGTVGVAIGISGIPGLVDERGWNDLFGFTLQITVVGVADELAAAASLVMGQAAEGTPVVHVRGFPYQLRESSINEVLRPKESDMFR